MAKFASTIILVAVIITVQGHPITYDEILAAAREGQWDQVQDLLKSSLTKNGAAWKPSSFNSVRDLKPTDGGHVYGEAEYSFHSASNIDGKTSEDHAGHKIINDDGKVNEFDFTPSSELPLLPPIITSHSQTGNDYSASDYSFQYAPTGVGETAEYIGGKKVVNKQQQPHSVPSSLKLPLPPLSFTGVRDLKPENGGHVYGEAQYAYHSATNVNGKTSEQQGGHKLINNDGKIKEFDFQPKTLKPFFPDISFTEVRDLKPPHGGQVYGEAQYAYHSATNVNGKTSEDKGGHKVINNNGKVKEFDFTPSPGMVPLKKVVPLSLLDKDIGDLKSLFID